MKKIGILLFLGGLLSFNAFSQDTKRPNIIYILTDDLGIGDVSLYNAQSKIKTANIDRLGDEGMTFNDVHSSSSVCTPSRYSILTGRYAWRSRLKKSVLYGYDEPLIDSTRLTVADLLRNDGYSTASIGKWHLGLGWAHNSTEDKSDIDYTKNITGGPNSLGFDYFYGISASLDMPPFIYIENNRTVGLPTVTKTFMRTGPAEKDFEAINCVPDFTAKAVSYIKDQAEAKKPFFLYFALPSPHTPIVPNEQFKGKSGVTEYGDFVLETDWAVGELLKALDDAKIAENTIVVFTSDNGFAPYVLKTFDVEALGHYPSMQYRGYKADIWEGGHRVPFIVRWPAQVKAKSECNETVCLSDFMATVGKITNQNIPDNAAEDSYNILPYLKGENKKAIREATIHHSIDGNFAIRQGKWKLEFAPGSGGWAAPRNLAAVEEGLPSIQLYNLNTDIGEKRNVYRKHPKVVRKLTALIQDYIEKGRSTPGVPQKNDTPVDLWYNTGLSGKDKAIN